MILDINEDNVKTRGTKRMQEKIDNPYPKKIKTEMLSKNITVEYGYHMKKRWENILKQSMKDAQRSNGEIKLFLSPETFNSKEKVTQYKEDFKHTFWCNGRETLNVSKQKPTSIAITPNYNYKDGHWHLFSRHGVKKASCKHPTILWHFSLLCTQHLKKESIETFWI